MADVSQSLTALPLLDTNYKMGDARAKGIKLVAGWIACGASGSTTGQPIYGMPLSTIMGLLPAQVSGYHVLFDHTNNSIQFQDYAGTGSASGVWKDSSAVGLGAYTSVPFLAWGY